MSRVIPREIAMKTKGMTVVATGIATALLASASAPQDAAKVEVKVEAKTKELPVSAVRAVVQFDGKMEVMPVANVDPMTRQWIQRLTPILRGELRTLTSAAEPTPTQRREIALEGGRTLKMVAGNLARSGNAVNLGQQWLAGGENDPRKLIHDSIEAEAKAKLSPEQLARYQKEAKSKAEDRREVVLLNVVAKIEKVLHLSPDQREKLCDSLRSQWDESQYPSIEMLDVYEQFVPMIPDWQIWQILTADQQDTWQVTQKMHFGPLINNFFLNHNAQFDLADEADADLKAALMEAPKK